jgi:hypothetical protein
MSANTCELHVGRLLEVRVAAGYHSVRDVDRMIGLLQAHFGKLGLGERCVIAADWRNVGMMSPETAVRAREMLVRAHPRVIRSAVLTLPERSLANLQVGRLVREADNEHRRHFTNAVEQHRWLSEVLTEAEQARLSEFLDLTSGLDERAEPAPSSPRPSTPPSIAARASIRPAPSAAQTYSNRAPRQR